MRLAKLTLNGFKSFADRTEFSFDHQITGIVGPNGCGKSNVVDAIKWVLGERSSKSLRGTEMIDVIFAGSASRKPSGMASVTLTFENPVIGEGTGDRASGPGADDAVDGLEVEVGAADEAVTAVTAVAVVTANGTAEGHGLNGNGVNGHGLNGAAEGEESVIEAGVRGKRGLPIDTDVVEVERRLFRDGTSRYLINGKMARLRDIRELFLDTGIGADAYSIIEQGKVDAMLLANAQERRSIFEEAAGIAKYKQRRVEAQRKLERARANLTQTREQLESTERRLRLVRGQAAKARKFRELDTELAAARMAVAFEQYDDLTRKLAELTEQQTGLRTQLDEAAAGLGELEKAKQAAEIERAEMTAQVRELEQERLQTEHARQQASQRRQIVERTLADAQRQTELDGQRLADIAGRLAEADTAIKQQTELVAGLAQKLAQAEQVLAAAGAERAAVLESLAEQQAEVSRRRLESGQIERERVGLTASIQADRQRAEAWREQVEKLGSRATGLMHEERRFLDDHRRAAVEVGDLQARCAGLEGDLKSTELDSARLTQDRREQMRLVSGVEQQLARLQSRRSTLREMVDARVGYAEAVRGVLAARDGGQEFTGVVGPLGELIETEEGHAAAVEAALGSALQSLVIRSARDLPGSAEVAKLSGRVTFVPLPAVTARTETIADGAMAADMAAQDMAAAELIAASGGRLMSLRSAVKPRGMDEPGSALAAGVAALLDHLLGRTYVVSDLHAASLVGAGSVAGEGARFVTLDGAVQEADGRVTVGPVASSDDAGGVLQRRGELVGLERDIAGLEEKLAEDRRLLAEADAGAAALEARAALLRQELAVETRRLTLAQSQVERAQADAERVARECGAIVQERDQIASRLHGAEAQTARLRDRVEELGRVAEMQSNELAGLEVQLRQTQMRADAAGEQMSAARVEVGRLTEQVGAAKRELGQAEMARDDLARQERDLARLVESAGAKLAEHERTMDEASRQIQSADSALRVLGAELNERAEQLRTHEDSLRELTERVYANREEAMAVERRWNGLEMQRREQEVRRETLEQRAQEDLRLGLANDIDEYRAMMADGSVGRIDLAAAAVDIESLRDQIRRLGSVNMDAIDEESQLAARNEDLIKQVADIDAACITLAELIDRLNIVSRERFGEVFGRIQDHFGGQDGMFRKLFGGGKAEVRLMPLVREVENADGTVSKVETDEIDLLESGVEVIAKPPGKEPRSISQLSGGEKTLTAVALLMSIFRSKPSCFCILDEVDAALDEGNVQRFGGVVRQFTDHSHFIVITHNKRTMQHADRLFGITMQERGVSKRVSVRFEQIGDQGQIRTHAAHERGTGHPLPQEPVEAGPAEAPATPPGTLRRALAEMREDAKPVPA